MSISCVQEMEHIDVPYKITRLKIRIGMRYPQIIFHTSKTMNKGSLVNLDSVVPGEVADNLIEKDNSTRDDDDELNGDDQLSDITYLLHRRLMAVLFTIVFRLQWK